MVTISKKDAKEENIEQSVICEFHIKNPDQNGILESCEDCLIIQDDCGCDADSSCAECSPEEYKLTANEFETSISGDKSNIKIRGLEIKGGIILTREASLRLAEIIKAEME